MVLKMSVRLGSAARSVCEAAHKSVRPYRGCVRPYTPHLSPYVDFQSVCSSYLGVLNVCCPHMKVYGCTPSWDDEYDEHNQF